MACGLKIQPRRGFALSTRCFSAGQTQRKKNPPLKGAGVGMGEVGNVTANLTISSYPCQATRVKLPVLAVTLRCILHVLGALSYLDSHLAVYNSIVPIGQDLLILAVYVYHSEFSTGGQAGRKTDCP